MSYDVIMVFLSYCTPLVQSVLNFWFGPGQEFQCIISSMYERSTH